MIGTVVLYTLPDSKEVRPAIIIRKWSDELVQLCVFVDGSNDHRYDLPVAWKTSVEYSEDGRPGTWRYIE